MKQKQNIQSIQLVRQPFHARDISLVMKVMIGAIILSLVTSFSTHHVSVLAHTEHQPALTSAAMNNLFEREREILHTHANLSRSRYATVGGTVA